MLFRLFFVFITLTSLSFDSYLTAAQEAVDKELAQDPIRDAVLGEINALTQDDVPRAYFSFTTKTFRDTTSLEKFTEFVRGHRSYWGNPSYQWDNIVFYNDVAVVRVAFSLDGKIRNGTFFLKQENNQWKIMGMTMVDALVLESHQKSDSQ